MSWFKEWFNDPDYLILYQHRDETEAEELIQLLEKQGYLKPKSEVLDLACGNGRHSFQLALRNHSVTGLDLSDTLLHIAESTSKKNSIPVKFVRGDMRSFNFPAQFDVILNLFTSFGYFETDEENVKVISNVFSSLKQGGFFVLDYLNSEYLLDNIEPETVSEINELIIIQRRKILKNRVIKDIQIKKNGYQKNYREEVTLYSKADITAFFQTAGFTIVDLFGNYNGESFKSSSPRLILIGKK
mgnify:CR=1 FL=1